MLESAVLPPVPRELPVFSGFEVTEVFPCSSLRCQIQALASANGATYLGLAARWPLVEAAALVADRAMVVEGGENDGLYHVLLSVFGQNRLADVAATLTSYHPPMESLRSAISYGYAGEEAARSLVFDISPLLERGELAAHAVLPKALGVQSVSPFILQALRPPSGDVPPIFRPPEGCSGQAAAYWTWGAVLVETLTGMRPTECDLKRDWQDFLSLVPSSWDPLCRGVLNPNPHFRWGAQQVALWRDHLRQSLGLAPFPVQASAQASPPKPAPALEPIPVPIPEPVAQVKMAPAAPISMPRAGRAESAVAMSVPQSLQDGRTASPWQNPTLATAPKDGLFEPAPPVTLEITPRPAEPPPREGGGGLSYQGRTFDSLGDLLTAYASGGEQDLDKMCAAEFLDLVADWDDDGDISGLLESLAADYEPDLRRILLQMNFSRRDDQQWRGLPLEPIALFDHLDVAAFAQGGLPSEADCNSLAMIFSGGLLDHDWAPERRRYRVLMSDWTMDVDRFCDAMNQPRRPKLAATRPWLGDRAMPSDVGSYEIATYREEGNGQLILIPEDDEGAGPPCWQMELGPLCAISWDFRFRERIRCMLAMAIEDGTFRLNRWADDLWCGGYASPGHLWALCLAYFAVVGLKPDPALSRNRDYGRG